VCLECSGGACCSVMCHSQGCGAVQQQMGDVSAGTGYKHHRLALDCRLGDTQGASSSQQVGVTWSVNSGCSRDITGIAIVAFNGQ